MESKPTYKVQFTGQFQSGIEPTDAISAFAALAKIPHEQATTVLSQARVLKRQLDIKVAYAYRDKLNAIGLDVALQPETPQKQIMELSLEPIEDRHGNSASEPTDQAPKVPANNGMITCPKCGHEQKSAAQCESCGVYIHKVQPKVETETSQPAPTLSKNRSNVIESKFNWEEPQDPKLIAVAATTAVAIFCAFVWKWIAIATEYEVGLVAWGIGGAIGFAAIALGSIGPRTAIICGVLAFCSITGGKFLTHQSYIDTFRTDIQDAFTNDEAVDFYKRYSEAAQYYVENVQTDEDIRQFMVDYEYTEALNPEQISDDELQDFKEIYAADIKDYADTSIPEGEISELQGEDFINFYSDYSAWDSVKESLSPIDFLFFFLGIATAFRMGLTGRIK